MIHLLKTSGVILLLVFLVANCNSKKSVSDKNEVGENALVSMVKSSCFGKCEEYSVQINKKQLVYNGVKNMEFLGDYSAKNSKENFETLSNVFLENKFSELENSYLSGLRDLQLITITYNSKEVKFHERNAPEELKNIMKEIENLVKLTNWVKI